MYGMVNQAIKSMVEERFGADTWRDVHTRAGAPESFSAMDAYDDAVTYGLVGAACETLALPAEEVLRAFGEYWVLRIATVHYASLLASSGANFVDLLRNLDHMHQRIRVTFPNYAPPSFRVKPLAEGIAQVDYYSHREGLLPFVEGLFLGLGKHFSLAVSVEHVPDDAHALPCKRLLVRYAAA
jgi:hypothetical protein